MHNPLSKKLVLISLLAISIASCKKEESAKPTSATLTSGMTGVRNWRGYHYYYAYGPHYPTTIDEYYNLRDTSFALTIVNDSTIEYMGETFQYNTTDSTKKIHFFGNAAAFYRYFMGTGVAYFYAADSIVYCSGDLHSTSDHWERKDVRYTY